MSTHHHTSLLRHFYWRLEVGCDPQFPDFSPTRIFFLVEEEEKRNDDSKKIKVGKPIRELSSKELGNRLRSFGLKRVGDTLEKEGCTGDDFADFEEEDIDFFNIPQDSFKRILSGESMSRRSSDGMSFKTVPSGLSSPRSHENVIVVNSSTDLFSFDSNDALSDDKKDAASPSVGIRGRQILRRSLELMSPPPTPLSPSTPKCSTPGLKAPLRAPPVLPKLNKSEKLKILRTRRPRRTTQEKRHKKASMGKLKRILSQKSITKNESDDVKTLMRKLSQSLMIGNDIE